MTQERLQKIIAQAGLTSRRTAEEWISEGLVTINGKIAKLGDKASLKTDAIKVKGKLLTTPAYKVYYVFNKPKNVIAMLNEDEEGRPTIKDFVNKKIKERVFPVGRMDFTGEGLIFLTNDGDLAQDIQNSKTIIRRYQVKVDRNPTPDEMLRLSRPGRIEKKLMKPHHVRLVNNYKKNALVEISFQGMGSLDIRKFFENKGFHPERVERVGLGHLTCERMTSGTFKRIEASSALALLNQPELAARQINELVEHKSIKPKERVMTEATQTTATKSSFKPSFKPGTKTNIIRPV